MFKPVKYGGALSEEVIKQIIKLINNGKLKPGDKLPPERKFALALGVSRTVVRDALKTLAGLGIVTIRHGMGAFINPVSNKDYIAKLKPLLQVEKGTLDELYQIRKILETQAVIWCIEKVSNEDIKELEEIVERARSVRSEDASKLEAYDAEFHLKICEITGNRVLMRLMINLLDLLAETRMRTLLVPGRQKQSVTDHANILAAIQCKDADLAKQQMINHLDNVYKAIKTLKEYK